tara:strand:- start:11361 stop:11567 length:207 start_codon:yes stop_codon:yes gene_type:complete
MIVLNNIKSDMSCSISVVDINKSTTTNEYYKELWKEKYSVSLNKNNSNSNEFSKNLVKYLKGEMLSIE